MVGGMEVMFFEREINKLRKNIYVSRAISKLPFKTGEFADILRVFSNKYSEYDVKETCKQLYNYNKEIPDLRNLVAAYTVKNFKMRMKEPK